MSDTLAGLDWAIQPGTEVASEGKKYCTREVEVRKKVESDTKGNSTTVLLTASPTAHVSGKGECRNLATAPRKSTTHSVVAACKCMNMRSHV